MKTKLISALALTVMLSACGDSKQEHRIDGIVVGKVWKSRILTEPKGLTRVDSSLEFLENNKCIFKFDRSTGKCEWTKLDDDRFELSVDAPGFKETTIVTVSDDMLVPIFSGDRVEIYEVE